ncbi:hypothetical protein FOZ62_006008, partial [Perkinsus olseni]
FLDTLGRQLLIATLFSTTGGIALGSKLCRRAALRGASKAVVYAGAGFGTPVFCLGALYKYHRYRHKDVFDRVEESLHRLSNDMHEERQRSGASPEMMNFERISEVSKVIPPPPSYFTSSIGGLKDTAAVAAAMNYSADASGYNFSPAAPAATTGCVGCTGRITTPWYGDTGYLYTGRITTSWYGDTGYLYTGRITTPWYGDTGYLYTGRITTPWYGDTGYLYTGRITTPWYGDTGYLYTGRITASWYGDTGYLYTGRMPITHSVPQEAMLGPVLAAVDCHDVDMAPD